MAAVILHNMIIEDERGSSFENTFDYYQSSRSSSQNKRPSTSSKDLEIFLLRYQAIRNRSTHAMLKEDLINHLWNKKGLSHSNDSEQESEDDDPD
ncbi:hypothetical protein PSTG_09215 [Puccinia striiformis f. sp. tritici PST-78]|uniref:Uncharacterized protein n=3 Tax=Puccinia striiformis TaxID=27350 RepID=A0A0L0VE27_9BASI|nr:hypothetical protein PSTG_09215 [Puccinia striiformis f. sp. tritici PST-78]